MTGQVNTAEWSLEIFMLCKHHKLDHLLCKPKALSMHFSWDLYQAVWRTSPFHLSFRLLGLFSSEEVLTHYALHLVRLRIHIDCTCIHIIMCTLTVTSHNAVGDSPSSMWTHPDLHIWHLCSAGAILLQRPGYSKVHRLLGDFWELEEWGSGRRTTL